MLLTTIGFPQKMQDKFYLNIMASQDRCAGRNPGWMAICVNGAEVFSYVGKRFNSSGRTYIVVRAYTLLETSLEVTGGFYEKCDHRACVTK